MSGLGDGARNRGDVRPRVYCPSCNRSVAVTFDQRTGDRYLRPHVRRRGVWCVKPGESVRVDRREKSH